MYQKKFVVVAQRRSGWVYCAILLHLLVWTSLSFGMDQRQLSCQRQLEVDAIPGWARLKQSMQCYSGSVTWISLLDTTGTDTEELRRSLFCHDVGTLLWINGQAGKLDVDHYDISGKWLSRSISCFNPAYGFTRKQSAKGGDLSVASYGGDVDSVHKATVWINYYLVMATTVSHSGYGHLPLTDLLKNDKCKVISCSDIVRDGRSLVQVELNYPPTEMGAVFDPSTRRTTVVLDPKADWRVLRRRVIIS